MNKTLLRRIRNHILAEPRRLVMDSYILDKSYADEKVKDQDSACNEYNFAKCGTAACIAGWTVLLSSLPNCLEPSIMSAIEPRAIRALKITHLQAFRLFNVDKWPEKFQKAYRACKVIKTKARIAADRINHFIKTGR